MRSALGLAVALVALGFGSPSHAQLIVDFSPDTTGAPINGYGFINRFDAESIGDKFHLGSDSFITGGSIFSSQSSPSGTVGTAVRFVVLADVGGVPGTSPVFDVITTLDVVDGSLATSDPFLALTNKHATLPVAQFLPAGDYWFFMTGVGTTLADDIGQATGSYDDGGVFIGFSNSSIDLEAGYFAIGDSFFTLDGSAAVPEPSTWALLSLAAVGGLYWRRRRMASRLAA